MSKVEDFLTAEEEQHIIEAIQQAEKNTSGEIRVHIEKGKPEADDFERALQVFHHLKMDATEQRNGVLLYVAVEKRTFVICGDEGINNVVPNDFWDTTKDTIITSFKEGKFKDGLVNGILKAGEELKAHFPWQKDDINELSDEISKG